jgi:hypothetical protein
VEDQRIEELAEALAARPPRRAEAVERGSSAAVALLLRPSSDGPELLLIRRAEREGDPWSGHMALPGGRADPGDRDAAATAAAEPGATTEYLYEMDDGTTMSFPAYGARGHIVWGLTHRILTGFLELYSVVDDAERVREGDALIPDEGHGTDGPESG